MAHYLLPGSATTNFRLHVDEHPDDVMQRLRDGARDGTTVDVGIVPNDGLDRVELTLNPASLGWWTVMEQTDPDR